MSTLIGHVLIAGPTALALTGGGAAWHFRERMKTEQRRGERLRRRSKAAQEQLLAVETALGQLAREVIPELQAAAVRPGQGHGADLSVPAVIDTSGVAKRLREVAEALARTVRQVQYDAEAAARTQVAEVQESARVAAAEARRASEEATRAAVRSVASSLSATAARVSEQISAGMRQPAGEDAYASMVRIDHLGQQLLLVARSYVVLSGGKLSQRWPASSLTDVLRAAMGHVEGFERVKHEESDIAVTSRAVGPLIHILALLLNNALQYSPKTVDVQLREGHHGATVKIDDAGIQMNAEQLREARQILAGDRIGDVTRLGAHPRIGFPVAAALARDYGFTVEVEAPNAFMGTRASVFIPQRLLTTLSPSPDSPDSPVLRAVPAPAAETTASGLSIRRGRTPARHAAPPEQSSSGERTARPGSSSVATAWAAGTRRARQTPSTNGKELPSS